MSEFKVKNKGAAEAMVSAMIGWTAVGVDSGGNEVSKPKSPEVRAHLEAVLGDMMPNWERDNRPGRLESLADYLRSVADAISPPKAEGA